MFDLLKKCLKDIEPLILIERLRLYLKPNKEFDTLLTLQSSRLTALKSEQDLRTISQELFVTETNKVKKTLLEFIDELIETDFKATDKFFETITEEEVQEVVEFIQGHIDDLECSFSYSKNRLDKGQFDIEKNNCYFTFKYSNGLGVIEYQEYNESKPKLLGNDYIDTYHIEIPFKELKLLELENYKNARVSRYPLKSTSHIQQICFYIRNRKEMIKVLITRTVDEIIIKSFERSYDDYRLTVSNEDITQRIVNAFKFLMKANGAKQEMF